MLANEMIVMSFIATQVLLVSALTILQAKLSMDSLSSLKLEQYRLLSRLRNTGKNIYVISNKAMRLILQTLVAKQASVNFSNSRGYVKQIVKKNQKMATTEQETLVKSIHAINLLAKVIHELSEKVGLTLPKKYQETICFRTEMVRNAIGLADLGKLLITYGCRN